MTGDRDKFKSLVIKDGAKVNFGGNQSGKITGVGEVGPIQDVYCNIPKFELEIIGN